MMKDRVLGLHTNGFADVVFANVFFHTWKFVKNNLNQSVIKEFAIDLMTY